MDSGRPDDAAILAAPSDKYSRGLYLYLEQKFSPTGSAENRFEHAERRQQMLRHFQSEKYSSHYLGPKGAQPGLDGDAEESLKQRLAELFPQVKAEDILVEPFAHRESDAPDAPVLLYTLSAKFNGKHIHYPKIINGEDTDVDDSSTVCVRYSWHTSKGELSVFSDDETVRPELSKVFRDVVLGGDGDIHTMPMPATLIDEIRARKDISQKHHQWLSDQGLATLESQIHAVTAIARSSTCYRDFDRRCEAAFAGAALQLGLLLDELEEGA